MPCNVKVDFSPKKMYRCPCLIYLIIEIYNANIRNYSTILKAIATSKMAPIFVFFTKTDGRTNSIAVSTVRLEHYLPTKEKFFMKIRRGRRILL